jgi:hypothetical protein
MSWFSKLRGLGRAQRAIRAYNLGLEAKYAGEWELSLRHNQAAAKLNPDDEATWWNLAIAATALHDWPEARRGWTACGVTLNPGVGEVTMPECRGCVRIDPNGTAEVVWGKRIDPARIRVLNVPLPSSDRRYGDVLLNDGAEEGTRTSNGNQYPVMNELGLWQSSPYSTFAVEVALESANRTESLQNLCEREDIAFEDWSSLRYLCAACSRGNPGEHVCLNADLPDKTSRFGFAARSRTALDDVIRQWKEFEPGISLGAVELAVPGAKT